jgi:hypothetical protein
MATIRRTLAFPFYLVAFILHLLTALFTVIAQKIAGDDFETSRQANIIAIILICGASTVALTLWAIRTLETPVQTIALTPQAPMPSWRAIKTGFLPEQVVWAKPLINLTACVFAQRALRHALEPATVGFEPCGEGGKITTIVDDDYYEASVSGVALVNGKDRAFKVALNHYPPSTSEWGFIATDIQIEKPKDIDVAACTN